MALNYLSIYMLPLLFCLSDLIVRKVLVFTESCLFVNEGLCDNIFMGTFHDLHMLHEMPRIITVLGSRLLI